MKNQSLSKLLKGRNFLILQGPMGPFFNNVAGMLEALGHATLSVAFNGGDQFYAQSRRCISFNQTLNDFPAWLTKVIDQFNFDTILCFGDCRPLHQSAKVWARDNSVRFFVFEEGYLRPNYITLEEQGVNGYSSLPREADFYRNLPASHSLKADVLNLSALKRVSHAIWYCLMCCWYRHEFQHYQHHKHFSYWHEAGCWLRSLWRKPIYRVIQHKVGRELQRERSQRYYLAILQVYNDSQIKNHSPFDDVHDYIFSVMSSFSVNAPAESYLVLKHHPMDRGYRDYKKFIKRLSKELGILGRVIYVHDLPMEQLIIHAKSIISLNSTAGITALAHSKPLKVLGNALYDIEGLTYQGSLQQFWHADFKPDAELFDKFIQYLIENTQLNTTFYAKNNSGLTSFFQNICKSRKHTC